MRLSMTAVAIMADSKRYAFATVDGPGRPLLNKLARHVLTRAGVTSARSMSPNFGRSSALKR